MSNFTTTPTNYSPILLLFKQEPKMQIAWDVLVILLISGIIFEIIVLLPLGFQIYKRNAYLSSGFFVIFFYGCWADLIYSIVKTCMELSYYQVPIISTTANLAQWYFLYFLTFWNTVLALNRFTALIFVKYYTSLWTKNSLTIITVILFLYPFIINGYTFITNFNCRLFTYDQTCLAFMDKDMNIMCIINIIHAVGSFIIGIISYGIIKFYQKTSIITSKAANEQKLLLFSIFSSVSLIIFCCFQIFSAGLINPVEMIFWRLLTNILYIFWHYPGLIMLFMLR